MKFVMMTLCTMVLAQPVLSKEVTSLNKNEARLSVSRIAEVIKLETTEEIKVNLAVHDLGGSTDVSPTQELFLTLYSKGEMYDTEAAFNLGPVYSFKSARKLSTGLYEIKVSGVDRETSMPVNKTLLIDAQKAIVQMKNVSCEDFDCPASTNFKSVIQLSTK